MNLFGSHYDRMEHDAGTGANQEIIWHLDLGFFVGIKGRNALLCGPDEIHVSGVLLDVVWIQRNELAVH